jgi:hypothetical protein
MSDDAIPPDEAAYTDPAELERVMKLGAADPALQGLMFRLLLAARVWVPIPSHPELVGDHLLDANAFSWCAYQDHEGSFVPVFASEGVAHEMLEKLAKPKPMVAELPAKALLEMLQGAETNVRIIASNGARITLEPLAVDSLLKGSFTESRPDKAQKQKMTLQPLAAEQVPDELRKAILAFCEQRQGAMAVYAFHPADKATGAVNVRDLRLVVRLRDNPGHFYNDFSLMVRRMAPENLQVATAAANLDDPEGMAFFQRCQPLWPVV